MPCYNTAQYKRLQQLFCCSCNYTAKTQKPFTGLYSGVSVDLRYSSAHNTADTQAAYAQPAPRWRAYRQALHLHRYQIPPPRRTLYRAGQPPIIIRYIRVRPCFGSMSDSAAYHRPCQPGGVSSYRVRIAGKCWHAISSTDPAHLLRGQRLHLYRVSPAAVSILPTPGGLRSGTGQQSGRTLYPAEQSSSERAEPLAACRRISFRAFAR